jgi:hypothetical protein
VGAEGNLSRRLGNRYAFSGQEPLPVVVDQRNHGDGHPGQLRGQRNQVIKVRLGRCIQDVVTVQGG